MPKNPFDDPNYRLGYEFGSQIRDGNPMGCLGATGLIIIHGFWILLVLFYLLGFLSSFMPDDEETRGTIGAIVIMVGVIVYYIVCLVVCCMNKSN